MSEPRLYFSSGGMQIWHGAHEDVLPLLDISKVDVCVTDPPYEIAAGGGGMGGERADLAKTRGFTDCGFDYSILSQFNNWLCFGTLRQVPKLIEAAGDRRWMLITWNKPNPSPLCKGNYLPDTEYIIHAWRDGALFGECADKARFIVHRLGDKAHGEHPNEKPIKVMRKVIKNASDVGQTILDPFMGSGTTLRAAKDLGRKAIGIEQVERYCEIAARKLEQQVFCFDD